MPDVHLSVDARRRLDEELAERSGPRRREISAWIERAREHGDIRENADYDAAKNEQGLNEARIRQIEEMLRHAQIVEGPAGDVVAPGTVVEIRMGDDADTTSYLVGSIEEQSDDFEVLSMGSPLGQALLGAAPGEIRSYEGPKRTFEVQVVSVRPVG